MNFRIDFSVSAKNDTGISMVIVLNLQTASGRIAVIMILILLINEHGGVFPSSGVFFDFFCQGFTVFTVEAFHFLFGSF
jgi:hypothetical protein